MRQPKWRSEIVGTLGDEMLERGVKAVWHETLRGITTPGEPSRVSGWLRHAADVRFNRPLTRLGSPTCLVCKTSGHFPATRIVRSTRVMLPWRSAMEIVSFPRSSDVIGRAN